MTKVTKQDSFREFAEEWRREIRSAWDSLPAELRRDLSRTLGLMPPDIKGWRALIGHAAEQVKLVAGDKQAVAIVGPVNTGKSTLYNQLIRPKHARASVSAAPGTTRHAQQAEAGVFSVVDTPGADAVGAVGEEEKQRALAAARKADLLIVLFDATHGIGQAEHRLYLELASLGNPMIVVLNKMDLVASERAPVVGRAAHALGLDSEQVIPLSAKTGSGIERLLLATAKSEPGIVAALGRALPAYRWKLAQVVIGRAASTAAVIALTPLPFLDFFPLVAVQSAMVLSIARIHAYEITLARARELLAAFGLGLLGRSLFYELSKLGGPPGWFLSAAVASGATASMGYAATMWFSRGERVSPEALRRIGQGTGQTIVDRLRGMGRRRLQRSAVEEEVAAVLESLPAPAEDLGRHGERNGEAPSAPRREKPKGTTS